VHVKRRTFMFGHPAQY